MENPCALQIIKLNNHNFELDLPLLKTILDNPKVKNCKVVVVSVAGAFRKGKSFLLSFFLRYLHAQCVKHDVNNWLENGGKLCEGFSWKNGIDRDTTGILMWSEIFTLDRQGEKTAIVVLDTQDAYDHQSTVKDCAFIFALSTLVSSVQVYNLSQMLQKTDLNHLHLFTEYAKFVQKTQSDEKPFQNLQFLIRDWNFSKTLEYGADGGARYLEKYLNISDNEDKELTSVRKFIKKSFSKINCFLMPHPGFKVSGEDFNGTLEEIDQGFKKYMNDFVPQLLSPENLIIKKINGEHILVSDLLYLFETYVKVLQSDETPKPSSIMSATAEINHKIIFDKAINLYLKEMESIVSGENLIMEEEFKKIHEDISKKALQLFDSIEKIGSEGLSIKFRNSLLEQINNEFLTYVVLNNAKISKFNAKMHSKNLKGIKHYVTAYEKKMNQTLNGQKSMKPSVLHEMHFSISSNLLKRFIQTRHDQELNFEEYEKQLKDSLEISFTKFVTKNEDKILVEKISKESDEAKKCVKETENRIKELKISFGEERVKANQRLIQIQNEMEKERESGRQRMEDLNRNFEEERENARESLEQAKLEIESNLEQEREKTRERLEKAIGEMTSNLEKERERWRQKFEQEKEKTRNCLENFKREMEEKRESGNQRNFERRSIFNDRQFNQHGGDCKPM